MPVLEEAVPHLLQDTWGAGLDRGSHGEKAPARDASGVHFEVGHEHQWGAQAFLGPNPQLPLGCWNTHGCDQRDRVKTHSQPPKGTLPRRLPASSSPCRPPFALIKHSVGTFLFQPREDVPSLPRPAGCQHRSRQPQAAGRLCTPGSQSSWQNGGFSLAGSRLTAKSRRGQVTGSPLRPWVTLTQHLQVSPLGQGHGGQQHCCWGNSTSEGAIWAERASRRRRCGT